MKKLGLIWIAFMLSGYAQAADYNIDSSGKHAAIQFKISHLGFSWLWGRFNDFQGTFSYDKSKPNDSKVAVTINPASVDTNHAKRDKHIRDTDFLDVKKYPKSSFVSTSYKENSDGTGVLKGNFTLRGVTKEITIDVKFIGEGNDPWGGYRAGFEGKTRLTLADYGIKYNLGPAAKEMDLYLSVEGIKK